MVNRKYILFVIILILMSCVKESKKKSANTLTINSDIKEEYYDNGRIKVRVELDNGIEHGLYYKFYENEMIKESGIKIKGKKNGLWKYNDSIGRIISAKHYYNDTLVYNLEIDDFNYIKKKLEGNVEVKIPKKWKLINDTNKSQILLVLRKECEKIISFCPNLTITYELPIVNIEIEDYLKKSNEILSSNLNNYRVIKERKYVSEGVTYFEKIYVGSSQDINIGGITTWVFDNKRTYIITGLALNEKESSFLKYEGLFKDIINNMKLH